MQLAIELFAILTVVYTHTNTSTHVYVIQQLNWIAGVEYLLQNLTCNNKIVVKLLHRPSQMATE